MEQGGGGGRGTRHIHTGWQAPTLPIRIGAASGGHHSGATRETRTSRLALPRRNRAERTRHELSRAGRGSSRSRRSTAPPAVLRAAVEQER
jgi:hypothetical protein